MSTFLELAQETRALSGIGGTGPVAVTGVSGIEARIVNYVKNSWIDIQMHPKKWQWMWGRYLAPVPGGAPLQTITNTREYPLTDVNKVRVNSFRSYLTATGISDRQRMIWLPWVKFDGAHGTVDELANRPIRITRDPTGQLVVYPKADDIYSIEFEFFKGAQVLAANSDIPEMPTHFHQLIVYEALKRFGKAEDAPEIIKLGEEAAGSEGSEGVPVSGLWRALIWDQEYRDSATEDESDHLIVRTREAYEDY